MPSNYPPGMSESQIPGIDDEDYNYVANMRFVGEPEGAPAVARYIAEICTGYAICIDLDSYKESDGKCEIYFDIYGAVSLGRHFDEDEVKAAILEDLPATVKKECELESWNV